MKAAALSAHANAPLQIFPTSSAQPANWNRFKSVSPFLRCPADAICRQCGQHLSRARQPRSPLRLRAEGESISAPNFSSTQRTPKVERGGWQQACVASGDGDVTTGEWETGHRQRRVEKVLTATRIGDEGAVRVMGPGTDLPQGFGPFLSLDEFFLAPSPALSTPFTPPLLESLVYFLEPPQPEPSNGNHPADDLPPPPETSNRPNVPETFDEVDQPRHGLQIFLRSAFQPVANNAGEDAEDGGMRLHWPIVNHGREADFVPEAEAAGARVKVVAGGYGGVKSGPPLDQFQLLDVSMGSDCRLELPLHSEAGALVYILEGVGLFGGETAGFASASYQNEGHALWLPGCSSGGLEGRSDDRDVLLIRTNRMSGVRFIFLSETSPNDLSES